MKYVLFSGCTMPARGRNYEMAARHVAEKIGLELIDEPRFTCCGYPVKNTDKELSILMGAANLAIAEKHHCGVCTLCSACTAMLAETAHLIFSDHKMLSWVNKHLSKADLQLRKPVNIRHFSRILFEEIKPETLKSHIIKPLDGFRFAPHYGCHYLKPSHVHGSFDSIESPESLHDLIRLTGADVIEMDSQQDCCGGAVLAVEPQVTYSMAKVKLDYLKNQSADAMILICPFCAVVYDDNQRTIEKHHGAQYDIPVLYYPQLLGLAMGFTVKELGLKLNKVKTRDLISKMQEVHNDTLQ